MQITLRELQASRDALERIASAKFPAKIAFRLGIIHEKATAYLSKFTSAHEATVKKYGAQVPENPNMWQVLPFNAEAATAEINGLLDEIVTIERPQLTLDDLGAYEITPADCAALSWLIVEEAEQPKVSGASAD